MISGGNATLYVKDFDKAVDFYTRVLGMKLRLRAGNDWAEVEAGQGFVIGLHPKREAREPGAAGAVQIGLDVDEPLAAIVPRLTALGVQFDGPIVDMAGDGFRFANLRDMDGNALYLWEKATAADPR